MGGLKNRVDKLSFEQGFYPSFISMLVFQSSKILTYILMELLMKTFKSLLIIFVLFFFVPYVAMAQSYPTKIGEKLGNGIVNVVTGVAEIPKTVMITNRSKGPAYAATAGFMTGIVHMLGRTLFGAVDLVTFMVPTRPLVNPDYIWYNFNRETSYDLNWQLR